MSESPSLTCPAMWGALLLVLGGGCAGPSEDDVLAVRASELPAPARDDDVGAGDRTRAWAASVPSWLDDARPSAQLDLLAGDWRADAWLTRRTGRIDRDGPLDLLVAPLLGGRMLLGLWTGRLAQRPMSGLDVLAWNADREQWELLSYWPVPGQAGFELCAGTFRHGRLELVGRDTDAQGRVLATRTTLADITPTSLRWDRAVSVDEGHSWVTARVLELRRQADPASPAPDPAALLARDASVERGPTVDPEGAFDASSVLGRWAGSSSRLEADGRWTTRTCRYEAVSLLGGMAILDSLQEQGEGELAGLERVALWGRLGGSGRRLDRKSWEVFRRDDRTARSWAFAGDFRDGAGEFVHTDEHGRPQVRVVLEAPGAGRLAWAESTSDDGGASWTERVRIALVRDA